MKNFKNQIILVTGGTGAVGTNLVKKLLDYGAKVTVLDDFSQSNKNNLENTEKLSIIKGDINNKKVLKKVF